MMTGIALEGLADDAAQDAMRSPTAASEGTVGKVLPTYGTGSAWGWRPVGMWLPAVNDPGDAEPAESRRVAMRCSLSTRILMAIRISPHRHR
jgi:hypothetical protein